MRVGKFRVGNFKETRKNGAFSKKRKFFDNFCEIHGNLSQKFG